MAEQRAPSIGILYAWWRGDGFHRLPPLPGFTVHVIELGAEVGSIGEMDVGRARKLIRDGHRLYVARLDGMLAGHGWCATRRASIGELGVTMTLSRDERYLWDFETRPHSRGHGIYPRVLQEILLRESGADRFWIGHDTGNEASARGILRAGFQPVGEVYRRQDDALRFVITGDRERAMAGSELLGIPVDPSQQPT